MAKLGQAVRNSAACSTLELPFPIPAKNWFTLREVAELAGMSESFVEKKFDEGRALNGHVHNGGSGARETKRVPRVWLVAFLVGSARYDDAMLGDALIVCFRNLPREVLLRVSAAAQRAAADKPLQG